MSAVLSRVRPRPTGPCAPPARPPDAEGLQVEAVERRSSSAGFIALLGAFRDSGGTARGDALAPLLQERQCRDYVSLARLIGGGSVFGFKWRESLWIPMFQFDPIDLSLTQGLREVLTELAGVFDSWGLANWFAEGNVGLGGRRPSETLADDWPGVLHAAHARRIR